MLQVDFLTLSPHSRDLFHKVVPMSGTSLCSFANNDPEHIREVSLKFALKHGYSPPTDTDRKVQDVALVKFLRGLSESTLQQNVLAREIISMLFNLIYACDSIGIIKSGQLNNMDIVLRFDVRPFYVLGPNNDGLIVLTPIFDGDFFPRPHAELRRELKPKPTLTGVTEFEGLLFSTLILYRYCWSVL